MAHLLHTLDRMNKAQEPTQPQSDPHNGQASSDELSGKPTLQRRYARVVERTAKGLVRFEFSIGWTDLVAELAMPQAMFDEFCLHNQVTVLADDPEGQELKFPRPAE